jgi:hypothetical protein
MAVTEQFSRIDATCIVAVPPTKTAAALSSSIKSLARFFITWMSACADYYAAATMYEQLSKLSNAELRRRGLSRDTLARDVCQCCDRRAHG